MSFEEDDAGSEQESDGNVISTEDSLLECHSDEDWNLENDSDYEGLTSERHSEEKDLSSETSCNQEDLLSESHSVYEGLTSERHSEEKDLNSETSCNQEDLLSESHTEEKKAGISIKVNSTPASTSSCMRELLARQGFSSEVISTIIASWKKSTVVNYEYYIKKWYSFCQKKKIDYLCANEALIVEFLNELSKMGLSYGTINSSRTALATVLWDRDGLALSQHRIVKSFMKGLLRKSTMRKLQ